MWEKVRQEKVKTVHLVANRNQHAKEEISWLLKEDLGTDMSRYLRHFLNGCREQSTQKNSFYIILRNESVILRWQHAVKEYWPREMERHAGVEKASAYKSDALVGWPQQPLKANLVLCSISLKRLSQPNSQGHGDKCAILGTHLNC